MDWFAWVAPGVTLLGAGLAYVGARAGTRQRDEADRRAEWSRRFEIALGELADRSNPGRRLVGRVILESLVTSGLATDEDRRLTDAVLDRDAMDVQLPGRRADEGGGLDELAGHRDNKDDDTVGGP